MMDLMKRLIEKAHDARNPSDEEQARTTAMQLGRTRWRTALEFLKKLIAEQTGEHAPDVLHCFDVTATDEYLLGAFHKGVVEINLDGEGLTRIVFKANYDGQTILTQEHTFAVMSTGHRTKDHLRIAETQEGARYGGDRSFLFALDAARRCWLDQQHAEKTMTDEGLHIVR